MVCVRRAWLVMAGQTLALEDDAATYSCTELDLGYPEVREVMDNRPGMDGATDRTSLFGSRAITAEIRAEPGGIYTADEIATMFAHYMVPRARAELHYVLDRPGTPERYVTVRAAGYGWPVSGKRTWQIHLAWVAADPVLRDPRQRTATAHAGSSSGPVGRTYPLAFPRAYAAGGGAPTSGVIASPGDVPVRPLLRIYGPVTDPELSLPVSDMSTWYRVRFVPGFRIDPGRWVDVDTDLRTATADDGTNLQASVDWAWTVWPALPVLPLTTSLSITGTSTTGVTQVQALWQDGYLS